MDITASLCNLRAISFSVETSQTWIVPSLLPEATYLPSGLKATENTRSSCGKRAISLPVKGSHMIIEKLSAETAYLPLELKATDDIGNVFVMPVISLPVEA